MGILENTFRVSFYLSDKAIPLIAQSNMSEKLKDEYAKAQSGKMGRSITIKMANTTDAKNVIELIEIKLQLI